LLAPGRHLSAGSALGSLAPLPELGCDRIFSPFVAAYSLYISLRDAARLRRANLRGGHEKREAAVAAV